MEKSNIDILWVLLCCGMMFMMQAGFLCLETGLTRSKNNINVAMKNLADFCLATLLFWAFGYAFMFGPTSGGWIGTADFLFNIRQDRIWPSVFFLYQLMFCGTAVTILSGAVAERMRFFSYLAVAALIAGLIYPFFGHWAWNNASAGSLTGWLGARGFIDFAGSSVVHSVGGWSALALLLVIGPRTGRFVKNASPRNIPASSIPIATLGVFLLWFGWFGFNGGSLYGMSNILPIVIANTFLASSAGAVATLALGYTIWKRVDVRFIINGTLAGLVAITANANAVTASSAVIIGSIGGIVMLGTSTLLVRFRIDDVVDAIPVHLGAGIWGTLAVALFGDIELMGTNLTRMEQLEVQVLGIFVCFVWSFGATYIILILINKIFPLRITPENEQIGLNISEHGASTELYELFRAMDQQSKTQDLSLRVPEEPFTEVGQIAERYNRVMESLEKATDRVRMIVTTAMDGIITFSRETLFINTLNPAAEAIFGYREAQLQGQPITLLMRLKESDQRESDSNFIDSILTETDSTCAHREMLGKRANGSTFPMEGVVTKASNESFYAATFRDITKRKQTENDLKNAKNSAQAASKAKSLFLKSVSHELRTPMNIILGFAQLLESDPNKFLADPQKNYVRLILKSGNHLLELIDEILDFTKNESEIISISPENISVRSLIDVVCTLIEPVAVKYDITIIDKTTGCGELSLIADFTRMKQVLINIITNGIKYNNKSGSVTITCEKCENKRVRLSVEDTGKGISKENIPRLFDPFSRLGAEALDIEGAGIGLTISKKLVEMMGGKIGVESEVGKGSKFFVDFPIGKKPDETIIE